MSEVQQRIKLEVVLPSADGIPPYINAEMGGHRCSIKNAPRAMTEGIAEMAAATLKFSAYSGELEKCP